MKVWGVTYSDERMTKSAQRCVMSMKECGVNETRKWGFNSLSVEFYENNEAVLSKERGAGYWLWKPYVINKFFGWAKDGDILIYSDAGVEFIAPVSHITGKMDEDIFFFSNGHDHVKWCKTDVIHGINHSETHSQEDWLEYQKHKQVQASVIFFKVNDNTRKFVKEWLLWCQMPGFIDDSPSKEENYPSFREHRHDQAVICCLQIKYGYKLHWWSTQYSQHIRMEGDNYPVMFNHHRMRNEEYKNQMAI